ncbi:MAG: 3'-5' exonuclease [Bdellovibrionia bacterium]
MPFHWIGKSEDQLTVTLKHLDTLSFPIPAYATPQWVEQNQDLVKVAAIVDCETTGLNHSEEEIIEIGIQLFQYNKASGEILTLLDSYNEFQEPLRPLRPEITLITGITDQMLAGKKIDWNKVDSLFDKAQIIIAHNARFDRPFIETRSKISPQKVWGCSIKQIDWLKRGYTSSKLELLSIYHGFFTDAHRAIHDARALLYVLGQTDTLNPKATYLLELLNEAKKPLTHMIAISSPFESKDMLKNRGYSWDVQNRFWSKVILKDHSQQEIQWLEENVYLGPFRGISRDIPLTGSFK